VGKVGRWALVWKMLMFLGEFDHSVDSKGRIAIPARLFQDRTWRAHARC
jgi:hypothetical protein